MKRVLEVRDAVRVVRDQDIGRRAGYLRDRSVSLSAEGRADVIEDFTFRPGWEDAAAVFDGNLFDLRVEHLLNCRVNVEDVIHVHHESVRILVVAHVEVRGRQDDLKV